MEHAPQAPGENAVCLNCGATLAGAYCSACGQSAHEGHEPGIGHFLHEVVHEFVHLDGKVLRTVRALLSEPGRLTEEYWAGRVVSWVRPIRLFLVAAALHWLASTGVGPLNLQVLLEREPSGEFSVSIASDPAQMAGKNGRVAATAAEHDAFLEKFRHVYAQVRYSSVLGFALVSFAIFYRRQPYFARHLVAALHFYAFWYLLAIVGNELGRLWPVFGGLSAFVSLVYLVQTLRRLYAQSLRAAIVKALVLVAALSLIEMGLALAATSRAVQQGALAQGPPTSREGGH